MPDGRLKLPYPVFSGSEFGGQFVCHFYGLLVICLSSTGGSVKRTQNRLPSPVKFIASFGLSVGFGRKGNDPDLAGTIIAQRMPRT